MFYTELAYKHDIKNNANSESSYSLLFTKKRHNAPKNTQSEPESWILRRYRFK